MVYFDKHNAYNAVVELTVFGWLGSVCFEAPNSFCFQTFSMKDYMK